MWLGEGTGVIPVKKQIQFINPFPVSRLRAPAIVTAVAWDSFVYQFRFLVNIKCRITMQSNLHNISGLVHKWLIISSSWSCTGISAFLRLVLVMSVQSWTECLSVLSPLNIWSPVSDLLWTVTCRRSCLLMSLCVSWVIEVVWWPLQHQLTSAFQQWSHQFEHLTSLPCLWDGEWHKHHCQVWKCGDLPPRTH